MDRELRTLERAARGGDPSDVAAYHAALCRMGQHHGIVMHVHALGTRWRDPSAPGTVLLDGAEVWPAISLGCRRCHRPLVSVADVAAAHFREAKTPLVQTELRVHDFPACTGCSGRGKVWHPDATIGPARNPCGVCGGTGVGAPRPRWRHRFGVLGLGEGFPDPPLLAMHLDGRQSGRTTRMVREAERHLADPTAPPDRVIVVAPTLAHLDHIATLFTTPIPRGQRGRMNRLRFATPDRVADHTRGSPLHYVILRDHSCSVQDFDRWPDEDGIP